MQEGLVRHAKMTINQVCSPTNLIAEEKLLNGHLFSLRYQLDASHCANFLTIYASSEDEVL